MNKTRVGLLCGGQSAEHEVSLMSAKSIAENIDPNRFQVVILAVDKGGRWYLIEDGDFLKNPNDPKRISLNLSGAQPIYLAPGGGIYSGEKKDPIDVDVVFSVLHGTFGEDGATQGLMKILGLPFVGPDVLASAVGMDKDVSKRLLKEAGIPIADFVVAHRHEREQLNYKQLTQRLGSVVFVKPANTGSSVGISKVKTEEQFNRAIDEAFNFDTKILIEKFIKGREIEISVIGNEEPSTSIPGEIIPKHEFYSYEAKYLDENGAVTEVPAKLDAKTVERIQELAIRTFKVLNCEGLARVDFFLDSEGHLFVNEINTLPGFTKISMYPKMWGASGVGYKDLLAQLIDLAIQRKRREETLSFALKVD